MDIYTLNVGQGNLTVVKHRQESVVIDTRIPPAGSDCEYVKGVLSEVLADTKVVGLILTGFDCDHADSDGVKIVINKYQPNWVMYPAYKHETTETGRVFRAINAAEAARPDHRRMQRVSVRLDKLEERFLGRGTLAANFDFELFSPHISDLNDSNSGSLVVKLTSPQFSYLVTGDTENTRWANVNRIFKANLKAHVMAAPHHGSKGAANAETLGHVKPHTVLVSAGKGNQFGHPHAEAMAIFRAAGAKVYSTSDGQSLWTRWDAGQYPARPLTTGIQFGR